MPAGLTSVDAGYRRSRVRSAARTWGRCRVEPLRHLGWQPYTVESCQSWCGHTQESIPFPREDELHEGLECSKGRGNMGMATTALRQFEDLTPATPTTALRDAGTLRAGSVTELVPNQ